jgi:acyl-CoA thioester hydrolase
MGTPNRAAEPVDTTNAGFRYPRRVQFHETDQAGVAHFSWFFRYMEEAEHALWRAAGLSIDRAGCETGWPRVSATFDFKSPLYFEDEFDVVVRVHAVTRRTIQYSFVITRAQTAIGAGSMTAACVSRSPGHPMRAVEVPPDIIERLRAAAGQSV